MKHFCLDMNKKELAIGDKVEVYDDSNNLICVAVIINYHDPLVTGEIEQIEVEWTDKEGKKIRDPLTRKVKKSI